MTPQKLMGSILSLAVQGKLVEQLDIEGTADSLYEHLIEKNSRRLKTVRLKNLKHFQKSRKKKNYLIFLKVGVGLS